MCGIVGIMSSEGFRDVNSRKKFFMQSLYADAVRGWDSTGVFGYLTKKKTVEYYKRALTASDFIPQRVTSRILSNVDDYTYLIGHNRAATKGAVEDITAHPFNHGNITGVHNGTIYNHRTLTDGNKFTVDSEAIINALDKDGIDILKELDGGFALVWVDENDATLNLIRNDERPLHIAYVKDQDTVLLASEGDMLRWLAIRNEIEVERLEKVISGQLYTFSPEGKSGLKKPERKKIQLREKRVVNTYSNNNTHIGNYGNTSKKWNQRKQKFEEVDDKNHKSKKDILKSVRKKEGEKLDFIIYDFEKYTGNSTTGSAVGFIEGQPWLRIKIHGSPSVMWNSLKKGEFWKCVGNIDSAYSMDKYSDVITCTAPLITNRNYKPNFVLVPGAVTKFLGGSVSSTDGKRNIISLPAPTVEQPNKEREKDGEKGSSQEKKTEQEILKDWQFIGQRGEEITKEEWEKLIQDGCCNCQSNISYWESGIIGWLSGQPLCTECVNDLDKEELIPINRARH